MIKNLILLIVSGSLSFSVNAETPMEKQEVYKLSYIEREPGTEEYEVTMLVSDRYIRVDDEEGGSSGYIIYDDKYKTISSVSHYDKSVLVIKETPFSDEDVPVKPVIEFLQLSDAPTVSGEKVYNYRVFVKQGKTDEETCSEIQLIENILPDVRSILQNYQRVVSGQQVKMVDNKISDRQTACFYVDQIYNSGRYYAKGLPLQEWHSNERSRILTGYEKVSVDSAKFKIPEKYRKFSIGDKPKILLE
ncbi:MAG TPA: hypothetical protein ENJ87_08700 [Gammaproteobacteria bacterium]|nr:hypothetical protein [Gammaproteobacteria bacterium]